jgi:hypothetical protein
MRTDFDQTIIHAIDTAIRNSRVSPLFLGGTVGSGGGVGSPPGGYIGYLPQTRVSYDLSELAASGFAGSGMSLLDNLNHIRYRLQTLESGTSSVNVYLNDVLVAEGVTVLNFEGSVSAVDDGGGQVTITISGVTGSGGGSSTFLGLTDTPSTYTGQTGKAIVVNGTETGLEFVTTSGFSDKKVKVSANDTTENYLENKVIAGTNVEVTVINEGGNEQLQITASGATISGQYRAMAWTSSVGSGWMFESLGDAPVLLLTNLE